MPLDQITSKRIQAFTQALRARLLDRTSGFGKQYLKLLVDEIRIEGNQAEMTGSYAAVIGQTGPDINQGHRSAQIHAELASPRGFEPLLPP